MAVVISDIFLSNLIVISDIFLSNYRKLDTDLYMYRWNTRKMSESERFAHMFDKSIGLVRKWSEIRVGLMVA